MTNETYQKILDIAEALFSSRGYDSVRLRDISSEIGIKHSALYYYVPNGKEALYVQVMERSFERHRAGMEDAIAQAGESLRAQMQAVADWLLSNPPVNLSRMAHSDFRALSPENAEKLSLLSFEALRTPLENALQRAQAEGVTELANPGLAAISFITLIATVHAAEEPYMVAAKAGIVRDLIDMMLNGWLKR